MRMRHSVIHHHERPGPAAGDRAEGLVVCPRIANLDALSLTPRAGPPPRCALAHGRETGQPHGQGRPRGQRRHGFLQQL